jgi:uncharacterized protein YbjT (DUF2867 family)
MIHLITGATGNVGGRVVEQLVARGERPRVFVRDAARARARFGDRVDIAVGDLADPSSLAASFAGAETLFLLNSGSALGERDEAAAQAARAVGVRRLVKLSSLGARLDARTSGRPTAVALWHAQGEAAIRASGLPFTFIQSVGFMTNALAWARTIKSEGVVRASTGEGKIAMIHPDDIAAVAVAALTTNAYQGQALAVTGPEALTYAQMVAKIGAAIGKPLRFEAIGDDQARQSLLRTGMSGEVAAALVTLWREVREGCVETVTDAVARVTGRKPISFDAWTRDNAQAFRGDDVGRVG